MIGLLTLSAVVSGPHQFVRGDLVLTGDQLVDRVLVVEEELHPDEGLAAFLRQHMPRLRSRQQVGDAAL